MQQWNQIHPKDFAGKTVTNITRSFWIPSIWTELGEEELPWGQRTPNPRKCENPRFSYNWQLEDFGGFFLIIPCKAKHVLLIDRGGKTGRGFCARSRSSAGNVGSHRISTKPKGTRGFLQKQKPPLAPPLVKAGENLLKNRVNTQK